MKLLSINPFCFNKGFKYSEIKGDMPFISEYFHINEYESDNKRKIDKPLYEYLDNDLKKFVNNDFDEAALQNDKLRHLLPMLERFAAMREPKFNPYFEPQNTFEEETTPEFELLQFLIIILNSLTLSYLASDFHLGKLDKLSDKDRFKRKELTIIQKYVIIARLLDCFLNEIKIKNKPAFNVAFHYIVMRFIDKTEKEAKFLNDDSDKNGILVSRGSIFLSSKFRSPVSCEELQHIYAKIKKLYQYPEPLEEFYGIKACERFLESHKPPTKHKQHSNKIWSKSFFIKNIKKYKNQSELAKILGISRQRISFMKKKLNISQKDIINF